MSRNPNFLHITDDSSSEPVYLNFSLEPHGIVYSISNSSTNACANVTLPNSSDWTLEDLLTHFNYLNQNHWIQNAFYDRCDKSLDLSEPVKDIRRLHILMY
jgi:hypothetical protein